VTSARKGTFISPASGGRPGLAQSRLVVPGMTPLLHAGSGGSKFNEPETLNNPKELFAGFDEYFVEQFVRRTAV
jgi:hypothetical protein